MKTSFRRRSLLTLLCLLAWSTSPGYSTEPQPVLAPFGLSWGLGPEDLEEILLHSNLTTVARHQEGQTLRLEVVGLPQKNLRRTIFQFQERLLCEVELQLGGPNWDAKEYDRFFQETKKVLETRYGKPVVLPSEKHSEGNVATVLEGYSWSQFGGNIQLVRFQARNPSEKINVLSQHYRAF